MLKSLLTRRNITAIAVLAILVTSCYKIQTVHMPGEVEPGQDFTTRCIVTYDQADEINSWGCYGILIPDGWSVKLPAKAINYYKQGMVVASTSMVPNEVYTAMMNFRYPREGYTWYGFSDDPNGPKIKHKKEDTDSVAVVSIVTAGEVEGTYELEFLFGDEEENFTKYTDLSYNPNADNRLFECGTLPAPETEAHIKSDGSTQWSIHQVNDCDTKVTVVNKSGIDRIEDDLLDVVCSGEGRIVVKANSSELESAVVKVYSLDGRELCNGVVVNGAATLNAQTGTAIVMVLKGNKQNIQKVIVK